MSSKEQLFKYFKPNDNTNLSTLKGFDLQDLIILLNRYYLEYRKTLGLQMDATFGLEIEVENTKPIYVNNIIKGNYKNKGWFNKDDHSLKRGTELNSPILRDTEETWIDLKNICAKVRRVASIGECAGGHIHIGTQTLGSSPTSWINFIMLWSTYENILFRFCNGEYLNSRPKIEEYAEPISKSLTEDLEYILIKEKNPSLKTIISTIAHSKYEAINFDYVEEDECDKIGYKNTIEFRCPNGTIDPIIWQNNVNTLVKILTYSRSTEFDRDIVNKRHELISNKYDNLNWYNDIFISQALEFADLVFNNNKDKLYFLRQYLKSMEICDDKEVFEKAKRFTRTKK